MLLFVLSGFTSLVYQAVWIRMLSLSVGSTSASMSIVLSIFFFGLAAGSYFFARWAERIRKPLLVYGYLEGAIGVLAVIVLFALLNFQKIFVVIYPQGSLPLWSHVLKFALVFLILILPTFFMGATLPLLIRLFTNVPLTQKLGRGQLISLLYGVNTVGAVLGAFASGFVLYPRVGIDGANYLAALGNLLICVAAIVVQRRWDSALTLEPSMANGKPDAPAEEVASAAGKTPAPWLLMGATFVTGFCSISIEVIWSKYLGIFLGTNIYGLSLILCIFLMGLSTGSLLLTWLLGYVRNLNALFAWLMAGVVGSTAVSILFLGILPIVANVLAYYTGGTVSFITIKSLLCFATLLTPTIFFGALLPLTIELLTSSRADAARSTGYVYSANTVGGILGSCLTGLVFIPRLGSAATVHIALGLLLLVAILVSVRLLVSRRAKILAVASFILLGGVAERYARLDFENIIRSAYQQALPPGMELSQLLAVFSRSEEEFKMVYEGETAVISLSNDADDGPDFHEYLRLKTNGLNESIYSLKNPNALPKYEALLGLLPYTLVRDPQNAFIVGYGGGYSPLFFDSTDLKHVLVAEIEKGILEAAAFAHDGEMPFRDSQMIDIRLEDARFLLAAGTGAPYDIIASQPSHSWLSGVANLFTIEFFELVRSRLKPHGVFSQWLNLYNMDTAVLNSILKTFFTAFPHGAVFSNLHDDELILIGSLSPVEFNVKKVEQIFKSPAIANKVSGIPLQRAADLISHLVVTREEAMKFAAEAPMNSDKNAFAEIAQSNLFYGEPRDSVKSYLDNAFRGSYASVLPAKEAASPQFTAELMEALFDFTSLNKMNTYVARFDEAWRKDPSSARTLARYYFQLERYQTVIDLLRALGKDGEPALEASALLTLGRLSEAEKVLRGYPRTSYPCQRVILGALQGKPDRALAATLASDATDGECDGQADRILGEHYVATGEYEKAWALLQPYQEDFPSSPRALELLLGVTLHLGFKEYQQYYAGLLPRAVEDERARLIGLVAWLRSLGHDSDADAIEEMSNFQLGRVRKQE